MKAAAKYCLVLPALGSLPWRSVYALDGTHLQHLTSNRLAPLHKKYNDNCINSPDSSYSASVSQSPPHPSTSSCLHCHRQAKRRRAARNCLRTWRNLGSCVSVAAASRTRHWPSRSKRRRLAPSGSAGPMPASQSAPCRPFPFTSCEEPQGE